MCVLIPACIASHVIGRYEIGLALSVLSNIVTPDLARDMLQDITNLMSKSRIPYVRQKATLIMYKLFLE